MRRRDVQGDGALVPMSSGAYSPAVLVEPFCFVSGQSPVDPSTNAVVGATAAEQLDQTLDNVAAILELVGLGLNHLVSVTIMLTDIADWDAVNARYARRFTGLRLPSRMIVAARGILPAGALLELQAVAVRADSE
jgi:2-iminobutanoate/2-iminopropanoate deaminase